MVERLKYNSLSEWRKENPKDYKSAYERCCLEKIAINLGWELPNKRKYYKPIGHWKIFENVLAEAKKYNSPSEWRKGSSSSYAESFKHDWYEKCCEHMNIPKKRNASYWSVFENVLAEALKYKTGNEWKYGSSSSYSAAFKHGWYGKCCEHMDSEIRKPKGYWDIKENVLTKAKQYKTRSEWGTGPNSSTVSYDSAKRNGWFEEATAHMEYAEGYTPAGHWTFERLIESAKKYKYIGDWRKFEKKAYEAARKKGCLEECLKHMESLRKKNGYWQIKENVLAEAKKYKIRSEWSKGSSSSYNSAKQNEWLDECTKHMEYAEGHTPAGYWTKEKVLNVAKKYNNRLDWNKNNAKSVNAAKQHGWFEEAITHMDLLVKPPKYWNNKELCLEDALKYKTKAEWTKNSSAAKKSAMRNGWFEEATAHMTEHRKPIGYWTKERCVEEALKYKTKSEWKKSNGASLQAAQKSEWYSECIKHMEELTKPSGYWKIKENVLIEALKYGNRTKWSKNSPASYSSAKNNGWFNECTNHMKYLIRPNGTWTKELLIIEAKKWNTLTEWKNLGEGYSRAKPLGCYDECVSHMVSTIKPMGYWENKEHCMEEALKYNSKSEWQSKNNGSMKAARKNGWLDECTAHMPKNIRHKK